MLVQGLDDEDAGPGGSRGAPPADGSGGPAAAGDFHIPCDGPGMLALPILQSNAKNQTATTIPHLRIITTGTKRHATTISTTILAGVHGVMMWSRSVT